MASSKARSKQRSGSTKAPVGKNTAGKTPIGRATKTIGGKGGAPSAKRPGPNGRTGLNGRPDRKPIATAAAEPFPRVLLGAGLLIGLYAMMPGFFPLGVHLKKSTEVVDHIIPGVIVLALVMLALTKAAKPATMMLAAGVVVLLAGFWMAATHYALVLDAVNHTANTTFAQALYHSSTAVAVGALGIVWVYLYRAAGTGETDRKAAAARRF
ncbi:MAG: hypothetical protein ACRDZ8_04240 [Acidimicrobiales bacterium]